MLAPDFRARAGRKTLLVLQVGVLFEGPPRTSRADLDIDDDLPVLPVFCPDCAKREFR